MTLICFCGRSVDEGYPTRIAPLMQTVTVEQPGEMIVHLEQNR